MLFFKSLHSWFPSYFKVSSGHFTRSSFVCPLLVGIFFKDGSWSSSVFPRWPHPFLVRGQLPLARESEMLFPVLSVLLSFLACRSCKLLQLNCIFSSEPPAAPVSPVCHSPAITHRVTSLPDLGCACLYLCAVCRCPCLEHRLLPTQAVSPTPHQSVQLLPE